MKNPQISYCVVLIFAQLTFQAVKGHAQSSGAPTEVPSSLISPLPEWKSESTTAPNSSVPTASSSQASIAENKTEQINDINSEEHNNSTTITEKTQIILEGFITGNDTVNLAPDVTEIESVKWNETTEIPQDLIRESDLSLSFISSSSHISAAASYLPSAGVAAIVAGILCTFGVVAYGGLIIWRRVLEKRYGNRELLVNEEFYDVNGLKYFEL